MKNLKFYTLSLFLFVGLFVMAGNEKVSFKTSAQCEMCKEAIETALKDVDGIAKVLVNIDTKEVHVKFDNEVLTIDDVQTLITEVGYWADDKAPNKEAYAALPDCCKPKKSCCASKSSCSKTEAAKKECNKEEKKSCSKDSDSKKSCTDKH